MRRAENYGIMQAKELTKQRMALFDLSSYGAFAAYMISAVEPSKDYTFGWAWQGAATAVNIVQLNSAYAEGNFYYLFDRCLLMGNDTVLLRIALLPRQERTFRQYRRRLKKWLQPAGAGSGLSDIYSGYTGSVRNSHDL